MNLISQFIALIKLHIAIVKMILKKIYIPERLKFILFLLAIFFSPFYLIFKLTIYSDTSLWMLHGAIITVLFIILIIDRVAKPQNNNVIVRSHLDKLVMSLLIYFIWLAIFGVINGSSFSGLPRIFWQFIIGVMVYFVAKKHLSDKRLKTLEIFIWVMFLIAISLFSTEIIAVNFFGQKSFFWSLAFYEQGLQERAHISYGGASLSWLAFRRITGFFSNHAIAATFISIGVIFSLFKILLIKINFKRLTVFVLTALTFIFACSRFPVAGFMIALVIAFLIMPIKYKQRLIIFLIILTIISTIAIVFSGKNVKILLKTMYVEKMYTELFKGDVIFGTAARYINRDWKIFKNYVKQKPLIFLTGSGFGYFDDHTMSLGGEFGWLIFFYRMGLVGYSLIGIVMFKVIKKVKEALQDAQMDNQRKYLMLACQSYMITALVATFHSGAMFHSANYFFFFLCLAIIAFIDERRQIDYNNSTQASKNYELFNNRTRVQ